MNGLPSFFQTQGTTVIDELTNLELDGLPDISALRHQRPKGENQQQQRIGQDTDPFGDDAFGDLNLNNLPSFFTESTSTSADLAFSSFPDHDPSSVRDHRQLPSQQQFVAANTVAAPSNSTAPVSYKTAFLPPGLPPPAPQNQQQHEQDRRIDGPVVSLASLRQQQQQQQQQQEVSQPYYASPSTSAAASVPISYQHATAAGITGAVGVPPGMPSGMRGPPAGVSPHNVQAIAGAAAGSGEKSSAATTAKPISYAAAVAPASEQEQQNQQPRQRQNHQQHQHNQTFPSSGRQLFNAKYPPPPQGSIASAGAGANIISPQSALFSAKKPLFFRPGKGFTAPAGAAPAVASVAAAPTLMQFYSNPGGSSATTAALEAAAATAGTVAGNLVEEGERVTGRGAAADEESVEVESYQQHQQQLNGSSSSNNNNDRGGSRQKAIPRGKFMSPSDVRFVVNRVLQPVESNDPYSDDFYFLQLSIKKNNAAREAAARAQLSESQMPPMIYVPLPTWRETKERIRMQIDVTRRACQQRSREWEEKEQVLGHMVRHDMSRPRAVLAMPTAAELALAEEQEGAGVDEDGDPDEEFGSLKVPFSSRLWSIRLAVQRGYEALYTVQELQHLLSSPLIGPNPAASAEIQREIGNAVALLSQSIGIRSGPTVVSAAAARPEGARAAVLGTGGDFSLDGGHVGAILQTNIGKKLISRSLKLLSPPHRWALLPVILAKTLLAQSYSPDSSCNPTAATAAQEARAVEQRLLRTIIEFLQYSYQFQIEQQQMFPPGVPAEFTNILLANLRQCIKSVMITQMEKEKLIQTLISERTRAEVMHFIVQIGDKICGTADQRLAEEWTQTREAFISMLDN